MIVIATDLHGVTDALRQQCESMTHQPILWLSPWDTALNPYPAEKTAHVAFLAQDGFSRYVDKIEGTLVQQGEKVTDLLGFSVGATAAWLYASDKSVSPNLRTWLFYGSRIRDYLDRSPRCRVQTIWAELEPSFNPMELSSQLRARGISAELVSGAAHGFMNPNSAAYSESLLHDYLRTIAQTNS